MASTVRRRLTAMRASVTMALLGLLAGLGIEAQASLSSPPTGEPQAHTAAGRNTIGSAQIKNHSLLFQDLKIHEVPSYKEYKEFVAKIMTSLGGLDAANLVHKIDVYSKIEADAAFLHKGDTADNALKIDGLGSSQLVQGHGQVLTNTMTATGSDGTLLVLIGLLRVSASVNPPGVPAGVSVTLTNTSDQPRMLNDGKTGSTIPPGKSAAPIMLGDGSVMPVQLLGMGGSQVVTLTLSSFSGGGAHTLVGQAVVGTP
jgi:hypothetical protein